METDSHMYEMGIERICNLDETFEERNEDSSLIQCTYEACSTKGKFFKCFLDNMFKQCGTYLNNI